MNTTPPPPIKSSVADDGSGTVWVEKKIFAIIVGVVLILATLGQAPQFQKHLNDLIHMT